MVINFGTASIRHGQDYFVRHIEDNIDWNKIRRGNIVFFYQDPYHYEIIDSKLETNIDSFTVVSGNSQFNYGIEIPSLNDCFYCAGDKVKVLINGFEQNSIVNHVQHNTDNTFLYLKEPLFSNGKLFISGNGSVITTKNKVFLKESYKSKSLYYTNYFIAQDFTKNLNLPLMDTTNPAYAAIALMYNRGVKIIDQAIEHSFIKIPNLIFKTEKLHVNDNDSYKIRFNPILSYEPTIFAQIQNSVTKEQYGGDFSISDIDPSGCILSLSQPLIDDNWDLNLIMLPTTANYSSLFCNFLQKDKFPKESKERIYSFDLYQETVEKNNYVLSLSAPCDCVVNKIITKTNTGFASIYLKVDESIVEESSIVANPDKYIKPLNVKVLKDSEISLEIDNITDARGLSVSVQYVKI